MGNRHGGEKSGTAAKEEKEEKRRKKKEKEKKINKKQRQKMQKKAPGVGSDVDPDPESSQFSRADSESLVFHSAENLSPYLDASTRSEEGASGGCGSGSAGGFYDNGQVLSSRDFHDGFSIEACLPADLAASSAMMMMMTSSDISTDTGSHRGGDDVTSMSSGVYGTPLLSSPDVRRGIPRSPLAARQKDSFLEPVPPIPSDFSSNTLSSSASYQEGVSPPGSGSSSTHRSTSSRASSSTVDTNAAHCIERLEELERNIERTIIEKFAAMDQQDSSENTTPRLPRRHPGEGERSREGSVTPKGLGFSGGPAQSAENSPAVVRKISEPFRPAGLVREGSVTPVGIMQGVWSQSAENSPVIVRKALPQPESPIILRRTPSQSPSVERKFPANAPESPVFYRRAVPTLDSPSLSPNMARREVLTHSPPMVRREGLDHDLQTKPIKKVPPPVPPKPLMKTLTSPEIARRLQAMPKSPIMMRKVYAFHDQGKDGKGTAVRDDPWERRLKEQHQHQIPPKSISQSPEVRHRAAAPGARKTPSSSPSPKSQVRKLMPAEDHAPPTPSANVSAAPTPLTQIQFCQQQRGIPVKHCTVATQPSAAVVLDSAPEEDSELSMQRIGEEAPSASSRRHPDVPHPNREMTMLPQDHASSSQASSSARLPEAKKSHTHAAVSSNTAASARSETKQPHGQSVTQQGVASPLPVRPSQAKQTQAYTSAAGTSSVSPPASRPSEAKPTHTVTAASGVKASGIRLAEWKQLQQPPSVKPAHQQEDVAVSEDAIKKSTESAVFGSVSPKLKRQRRIFSSSGGGEDAGWLSGSSLDHSQRGGGEDSTDSPTRSPPLERNAGAAKAEKRKVQDQHPISRDRSIEEGGAPEPPADGRRGDFHKQNSRCKEDGTLSADIAGGLTYHAHPPSDDVSADRGRSGRRGYEKQAPISPFLPHQTTAASQHWLPSTGAVIADRTVMGKGGRKEGGDGVGAGEKAWHEACYTNAGRETHFSTVNKSAVSANRRGKEGEERGEEEEEEYDEEEGRGSREEQNTYRYVKSREETDKDTAVQHRVPVSLSPCQQNQQKQQQQQRRRRLPSPLSSSFEPSIVTATTATTTLVSGGGSASTSDDNCSPSTKPTHSTSKNLGQLIRDAIILQSSSSSAASSFREVLTTAELSSSSSVGDKDDIDAGNYAEQDTSSARGAAFSSRDGDRTPPSTLPHYTRPVYYPRQRREDSSPSSTSPLSSPSSLRRDPRVRNLGRGGLVDERQHTATGAFTQSSHSSSAQQPSLPLPSKARGLSTTKSSNLAGPECVVSESSSPALQQPPTAQSDHVTVTSVPTPPPPPAAFCPLLPPPQPDSLDSSCIGRIDVNVGLFPTGEEVESPEGDLRRTTTPTTSATLSFPSLSATDQYPGHPPSTSPLPSSSSSSAQSELCGGHRVKDMMDRLDSGTSSGYGGDGGSSGGGGGHGNSASVEHGNVLPISPPTPSLQTPSSHPSSSSSVVPEKYGEKTTTMTTTTTTTTMAKAGAVPVMEKPTGEESHLPTAAEDKNVSDYKIVDSREQGVGSQSNFSTPLVQPPPSSSSQSEMQGSEQTRERRRSAERKEECAATVPGTDSGFTSGGKSIPGPEVGAPSYQERQQPTQTVITTSTTISTTTATSTIGTNHGEARSSSSFSSVAASNKPVPVSRKIVPVSVASKPVAGSVEAILSDPVLIQNTAAAPPLLPAPPFSSSSAFQHHPSRPPSSLQSEPGHSQQMLGMEAIQQNGADQMTTSTGPITEAPATLDGAAEQAEGMPKEMVPPPSPTAMDVLLEEKEDEDEEEDEANSMNDAHNQDSGISCKISLEMQQFGESVVRRLSSLLESHASESDSCLEESRTDLLLVPGNMFGGKQDEESNSSQTTDMQNVEGDSSAFLMHLETGSVRHIPTEGTATVPAAASEPSEPCSKQDSTEQIIQGNKPIIHEEKPIIYNGKPILHEAEPILHEELNTFLASDLPGHRLMASDTTETLSTTDLGDTTSASSKRESTASTATDETLTSFKTRSNTDSAEYEDAFILPESLVFVRSINEGGKEEKGAVVESGRIIKRPPIPAELTRRCPPTIESPTASSSHPKPRKKRRRQIVTSHDVSPRTDTTEPEPKRGSKQIEEVIDAYCEDMSNDQEADESSSSSSTDLSSSDADDILRDELAYKTSFSRSEQHPRLHPELQHKYRNIVRKPKPPADRSSDSGDDSGRDEDNPGAQRRSSSSHDSSFRIPEIEETFGELMGVKTFLDDLVDKTPTSESWPELVGRGSRDRGGGAGSGSGESPEDKLQPKDCHPSTHHRRRSKTSPARTDRTESDLDVSEHRDDASTDSMYADDEDEGAELVFQRSYSEEHGGEVVLSCTIYNSSQHEKKKKDGDDSDEFWADAADAVDSATGAAAAAASDASYKTLESAADAAGSAFRNARIQMHDIHQHLQDLRRQMEHLQDDITSTSLTLTPEFSMESEQRPVTE